MPSNSIYVIPLWLRKWEERDGIMWCNNFPKVTFKTSGVHLSNKPYDKDGVDS